MAIQATDGGLTARKKAKQAVIAAQKAVLQNPGNNPDAKNAKAILDAAIAAYDNLIATSASTAAETDPDVLAAKQLQSEAQAEVVKTQESIDALTAENQAVLSPEAATAISGLDTNVGLSNGVAAGGPAANLSYSPQGKKVKSVVYKGTGASRIKVTTYDDNTTDEMSDPETPGKIKQVKSTTYTGTGSARMKITTYDDGTTDSVSDPETPAGPTSSQQNSIAAIIATFNTYNLGTDIAKAITDMIIEGYSADTISLIAQDPTSTNPLAVAFQTRFSANATRIKNGLPPLSPSDYIKNENAYQQIMVAAGLPKGFYDSKDDFTKFIAANIDPTQVKARIDLAAEAITNTDPFYRQSLQQQYGLSTGDMIAHVLDPEAALPILQKQAKAVQFGAEAQRQGLAVNNATAMLYGASNISQAEAAKGFKTIAQMLPEQQRLAAMYQPSAAGNQGAALMADVFGGPNAGLAAANNQRLQGQEINIFSGSAGAGKGSLYTEAQGVL